MKFIKILVPGAIAALVLTTSAVRAYNGANRAEEPQKHGKEDKKDEKKDEKGPSKEDRAVIQSQRWSYPLNTCAVSGEKLEAKQVEFVVKGRLVRTCCDHCQAEVMKDPTEVFKKLDAAVIAAQKASYPLTTCAVTGNKLDDKAVDFVWGTRLVRLANRDAVAAFEKDTKAAMAKVDEAYVKAQVAAYPLKKCVVSGEALGGMGEPVDKLYGTTLVRFCCSSCVKSFEKDPDTYLKEIADAKKPAK